MLKAKAISFAEFKELFEISVHEHKLSGEPLPEMNDRSSEKIRSALEYPFQSAGGEDIYKTIEEKAASLLYSFAKGHYLSNGNKRTALLIFELFLDKNGYEYGNTQDLKELIYNVTTSDATDKENQIKIIAGRLKSTTMTNAEIHSKIEAAMKNKSFPDNLKAKYIADLEKQLKPEPSEVAGHEPEAKPEPEPKKIAPKKEKKEKPAPKKEHKKYEPDYDCDELIEKVKQAAKKRKAAAEKRADEPKKTPATKNKEAIERAADRVEHNVEKRAEKGHVSKAEIEKLIAEYEAAIKKLKEILSKL